MKQFVTLKHPAPTVTTKRARFSSRSWIAAITLLLCLCIVEASLATDDKKVSCEGILTPISLSLPKTTDEFDREHMGSLDLSAVATWSFQGQNLLRRAGMIVRIHSLAAHGIEPSINNYGRTIEVNTATYNGQSFVEITYQLNRSRKGLIFVDGGYDLAGFTDGPIVSAINQQSRPSPRMMTENTWRSSNASDISIQNMAFMLINWLQTNTQEVLPREHRRLNITLKPLNFAGNAYSLTISRPSSGKGDSPANWSLIYVQPRTGRASSRQQIDPVGIAILDDSGNIYQ